MHKSQWQSKGSRLIKNNMEFHQAGKNLCPGTISHTGIKSKSCIRFSALNKTITKWRVWLLIRGQGLCRQLDKLNQEWINDKLVLLVVSFNNNYLKSRLRILHPKSKGIMASWMAIYLNPRLTERTKWLRKEIQLTGDSRTQRTDIKRILSNGWNQLTNITITLKTRSSANSLNCRMPRLTSFKRTPILITKCKNTRKHSSSSRKHLQMDFITLEQQSVQNKLTQLG